MSKHWNLRSEPAPVRATPARQSWPAGATAGLAVVAACCVGVAVVLYQLAGPSNSFTP